MRTRPDLRIAALLAVLLLPAVAAQAAAPARGAEPPREEMELSEVVVSGEKPTRRVADVVSFLRRLLGQYTYSGYVDLGGKGLAEDRSSVRGGGTCVGFGVAPGVQCEIQVRWRETRAADGQYVLGGVSYLQPAMILYGLEPDEIGIRYLQVDNRGLAEGATGTIIGNTLTFRASCVDFPDGRCERVVKVTAEPESKIIDMQIDTEVDGQLAMRFRFQMTRVAELQKSATDSAPRR